MSCRSRDLPFIFMGSRKNSNQFPKVKRQSYFYVVEKWAMGKAMFSDAT